MINEKQAKKYCKEDISKIKNYDKAIADKTQTWHCHHMTETWWHCSKQDLIENECYYGRKACELIFLTPEEHMRLHMQNISDETRKKISATLKGVTLSDETRKKMSESKKGHTVNEDTRKKMSEAHKGHTVNEETRKKMSESRKGENHPMYGKKHSEETRKKMSEAAKRRHAAQS